jgi:hypothetical protein
MSLPLVILSMGIHVLDEAANHHKIVEDNLEFHSRISGRV